MIFILLHALYAQLDVLALTLVTYGAVVSMVNVLTDNGLLALDAASVTVIVQSEYVHTDNVLKVMVLFHDIADVVDELQLHPYVMVHDSVDENV